MAKLDLKIAAPEAQMRALRCITVVRLAAKTRRYFSGTGIL
jgi:hypothetical protein